MNELRLPYALDATGHVVHVDQVLRGKDCACCCPFCNQPVLARQGEIRQHHFAHVGLRCDPDGQLHEIAKLLVYERIAAAIAQGKAVPVQWDCPICLLKHEQNLLDGTRADQVCCEYRWTEKNIRADIALLAGSEPVALIEIVVTHEPSEAYSDSGIPVLVIRPSADKLETLTSDPLALAATHNYPCLDPPCIRCKQTAYSEPYNCGKCSWSEHPRCALCDKPRPHQHCQHCNAVMLSGVQLCLGCIAALSATEQTLRPSAQVAEVTLRKKAWSPPSIPMGVGSRDTCMCGKPKSICGHWPKAFAGTWREPYNRGGS